MADADATYEARAASVIIAELLEENHDMVVEWRRDQVDAACRPGHRLRHAAGRLLSFARAAVARRMRRPSTATGT